MDYVHLVIGALQIADMMMMMMMTMMMISLYQPTFVMN